LHTPLFFRRPRTTLSCKIVIVQHRSKHSLVQLPAI